MPGYGRLRIAGGRYFFTVNLADRRSCLPTDRIDDLRHAIRRIPAIAPFHIDAWVVLPDHMHAVWTLPEGDHDFPRRWRAIKDLFSRRLDPVERLSGSRVSQGERGIWQRRYWEHAIRDDGDFAAHLDYVHFNPVKHGTASIRPIGHIRRSAPVPHEAFIHLVGSAPTTAGPIEASASQSRTGSVLVAYRIGGALRRVGRQSASHPPCLLQIHRMAGAEVRRECLL